MVSPIELVPKEPNHNIDFLQYDSGEIIFYNILQ